MVHDVRPLHHAKMEVKFACRPCSKPFYKEGDGIISSLLACSRPPTCLLILYACKDMNWFTFQIAHALHGQICPNSQKDPSLHYTVLHTQGKCSFLYAFIN